MLIYIGKRILAAIPLLIILSIITFAIIQVPPGDYASRVKQQAMSLGGLGEREAEQLAQNIRQRYGLDQPVVVQYFNWIGGIVTRGDFGYSFTHNKPVRDLIAERLPRTLAIALSAHVLATLIGVGLGIYAATRQNRLGDNAATVLAFLGMTIPRFFLALVILYWLAFVIGSPNIGSLYSSQYVLAPWSLDKFIDLLKHIWPVLVIAAFGGLAYNLRVMRGNLLDVLKMQYVETARAKGLPNRTVILKHAVPNALHPLVMFQGVALPYMLTGELEVAIILAIPTVGPLLVQSMTGQDIYVTATLLLMLAVILVIGNLLADILLAAIDPRVRLGGA
ncbi:MAG: ABC transporter permease [Pseudomonadota bacterium]|nr:ABC transporter permease [Pseudomonadota bacterium]